MMTLKPKVFKKGGKQRCGRGFSREELKRAGLIPKEALKIGIPVDFRRRTAHQENVETIKTILESRKTKPKKRTQRKSKI